MLLILFTFIGLVTSSPQYMCGCCDGVHLQSNPGRCDLRSGLVRPIEGQCTSFPLGTVCTSHDQCESKRCFNSVCTPADPPVVNVIQTSSVSMIPRPPIVMCDATKSCPGTYTCLNNKCVQLETAPTPNGAPCKADVDCETDNMCRKGSCVGQPSTCQSNGDCNYYSQCEQVISDVGPIRGCCMMDPSNSAVLQSGCPLDFIAFSSGTQVCQEFCQEQCKGGKLWDVEKFGCVVNSACICLCAIR